MSRRVDGNSFLYLAAMKPALFAVVASVFIPGTMTMIFWAGALGIALLMAAVLFAALRKQQPDTGTGVVVDAPEAEAKREPAVGTGWPAPRIPLLRDALRRIDWFQFENLVAAVYELDGWTVQRRGEPRPHGVDVLIERDGLKSVVQCKHWKHDMVREKEMREFLATLTDSEIPSGVFVTLRGCTRYAQEFARKHGITLVNEQGLVAMLERVKWRENREIRSLLDDKQKYCPRCGEAMIRRTARNGWRAGLPFWGCSAHPRCDYVLDVA